LSMSKIRVRCRDIVQALIKIGLEAGDAVMLHSSLSSMGHVEGGALAVVEAFLEVLGPEGTFMVPTFTHSGTKYFDPLESPSKNGAITEAARKYPGAVRSLHPTHAVTVIGANAEKLVQDDLERGPLGKDCALDRLSAQGGYVFLLGVGHEANSGIHVGEDYAGDPDRYKHWSTEHPKRVILNHPEKGEIEILITSMMGSTAAFEKMEEELRARGLIVDGMIGMAQCQLMKAQAVVDATIDILRPILKPVGGADEHHC